MSGPPAAAPDATSVEGGNDEGALQREIDNGFKKYQNGEQVLQRAPGLSDTERDCLLADHSAQYRQWLKDITGMPRASLSTDDAERQHEMDLGFKQYERGRRALGDAPGISESERAAMLTDQAAQYKRWLTDITVMPSASLSSIGQSLDSVSECNVSHLESTLVLGGTHPQKAQQGSAMGGAERKGAGMIERTHR